MLTINWNINNTPIFFYKPQIISVTDEKPEDSHNIKHIYNQLDLNEEILCRIIDGQIC